METRKEEKAARDKKENRDPLSGEKGAHPVGVGVGATVGGGVTGGALGTIAAAATSGAAAGAAAGAAGAIVGAVAGGIVGGLVGKEAGEDINPTVEDTYWRGHYSGQPYVEKGTRYDEYAPAYRYGWESHARHSGRTFEEIESDLESGWDKAKGGSKLPWQQAKPATRDAWNRVQRPK